MKKISLLILTLFTLLTSTAQQVTTFAGFLGYGYLDGDVSTAMFEGLTGICTDNSGNIYLTDSGNHKIRKINTNTSVVSTIAGSTQGFADGMGNSAQFNYPSDICINIANTHLFVADRSNHIIRKIEISTGLVTTFAGSTAGHADGIGALAKFEEPKGLCMGPDDTLYVADWIANKIRSISPLGVVSTIAGSTWGYADAIGSAAQFKAPKDICIDSFGNLYISDSFNLKIRKITLNGTVTTIAGSEFGLLDGPLLQAQFKNLEGISIDANNVLYVTDDDNIRKINLTNGLVSTFVGSTTGVSGDVDGVGTQALLSDPFNLCVFGNDMYIVCFSSSKIKKVTGVLSSENFEKSIDFTIYPNPSVNQFTINSNLELNEMEIFDILGKQVFYKENLLGTQNIINHQLNKGYYIVVAHFNQKTSYQKLIVQ